MRAKLTKVVLLECQLRKFYLKKNKYVLEYL